MALPTIYIDTGGATTNSGSSDNNAADLDSTGTGQTVSVSGTTVTFSGDVDLSGVATDGSATIRIADATNTNQKIFKITAADDGANTVTVDIAPTGTISTSAWAIGGRFKAESGSYDSDMSEAVTAGWTVQFNNSPASHSGSDFIVMRNAGNTTDGVVTYVGKTGVKPVLTVSDTNQVFATNSFDGQNSVIRNLELVQQGASGNVAELGSSLVVVIDCIISDGGAAGWSGGEGAYYNCEISGVGDDGIQHSSGETLVYGCYIHDIGATGIDFTNNAQLRVSFTIIDTCVNLGINVSDPTVSGAGMFLANCTIYDCGDDGLRAADTSDFYSRGGIINCIFDSNGDAAGDYNIDMQSWYPNMSLYGWNLFRAGSGGATNLNGYTAASTDIVEDDPEFTDAANGDFSLASTSPAKAAGYPGAFLGGTSTGYLDIGAVQRQEPAGSGGGGGVGAGLHRGVLAA